MGRKKNKKTPHSHKPSSNDEKRPAKADVDVQEAVDEEVEPEQPTARAVLQESPAETSPKEAVVGEPHQKNSPTTPHASADDSSASLASLKEDISSEEDLSSQEEQGDLDSLDWEDDLPPPALSASGRPLVKIKSRHLSPLRPPEEVEVEEILFTQSVDETGLSKGPIRLRAGLTNKEILPISLQISEMVYVRTFVILSLLGFFLFMTYYLSPVLTPILFSLGLAYLLNPLVLRMEKWGIGRNSAISMFVLLLVVLLVSGVLLLLPALSRSFEEFTRLVQQLPEALTKLKVWAEVNFKFHFPKNFTEAISQWGGQIQKYVPSLLKPLTQFVSSLFSSGVNVLVALFNFLFIPLFTFYFLKDYKHVEDRVVKSIPPRMRGWALARLREMDLMVSGFIRGQITVSMIVGSCYMVLLSVLQVPMAPAIALGGAIINVVPYLGFFTTYLIAIVAALIEFQLQWQFFAVLIGMFLIHMLDVFIFTPKVVGEHTGLSELVVIIAILVGGKLFGIVGILLAVPMAAVFKVLFKEALSRYEESRFFRGAVDEEGPPLGG